MIIYIILLEGNNWTTDRIYQVISFKLALLSFCFFCFFFTVSFAFRLIDNSSSFSTNKSEDKHNKPNLLSYKLDYCGAKCSSLDSSFHLLQHCLNPLKTAHTGVLAPDWMQDTRGCLVIYVKTIIHIELIT